MGSPNTIDRKTRRLLTQLFALEGVEDGTVKGMCADRLKREALATAHDLNAEMGPSEVKITPWTPFNAHNTVAS